MYKLLRTLPLLLLVLFLTACAGRGGTAAGAGEVKIQVENNATPSTTLEVSAVPEAGTARLLGTVLPGATNTFTYDPLQNTTGYQLVARPAVPGAAQVVSQPITAPANGGPRMVSWELATNTIAFGQ